MEPTNENQDHLFFQLGLALLELIDKPIDLEIEQAHNASGLVLNGNLIRAFDTPAQADLSLAIGAHTISIRPSTLKAIAVNRTNNQTGQIQSVHLLFTDNFSLHLKPTPLPT
jgi:hypothetical protein